jgi:hypothetical protein
MLDSGGSLYFIKRNGSSRQGKAFIASTDMGNASYEFTIILDKPELLGPPMGSITASKTGSGCSVPINTPRSSKPMPQRPCT